ncbi:hypothetical protein PG997_011509 [Apiospora hydei]|uniref:F-box domain-containing protein n=1 Tax=Apiospora hydei TaxID=1337664 RepID=A0ABR1VJ93_9PEZI
MNESSLLKLPGELQNNIFFQHCDGLDRLILRNTCHRLRGIIPRPDVHELIEAEASNPMAVKEDLYTCYMCVRLRHRSRFAYNMVEKWKERGGEDASMRFCVDCGLMVQSLRDEKTGRTKIVHKYRVGRYIAIGGRYHVVCIKCKTLGLAGCDPSRPTCWRCWHAFEKRVTGESEREWELRELHRAERRSWPEPCRSLGQPSG